MNNDNKMLPLDISPPSIYYLLIAAISFVIVGLLPFLGSNLGIAILLPQTVADWIIWGISKGSVAVLNMLIFHLFIKRAQEKAETVTVYTEARASLGKVPNKKLLARSPRRFYVREYGFKGVSIAFTTLVSLMGLSSAILVWDMVAFLTTCASVVVAIVFGILEMNTVLNYLTYEYPRWVNAFLEKQKYPEENI